MFPDLDIYRAAQVLVREHGEDATPETAQRAAAMLEKGDIPMSALGHKQTSCNTLSNVRSWGQSGHNQAKSGYATSECPLLGVKRTFASYPLDVCL